jgi:hypothetical protein
MGKVSESKLEVWARSKWGCEVLEVSGQVCGEYENEKGCGSRYGTAGTGIGKRAGRCRDGGSENSWTAL